MTSNSTPTPGAGVANLTNLFGRATQFGTLSTASSSMLTGNLGSVVVAGAAGMDGEDIEASDVTLFTVLLDMSSSIAYGGLEDAVRRGQNELVDALMAAKNGDDILLAQWTFHHEQNVLHAYVPLDDATRLDANNYNGTGTTHLYDTWCDALAANVAYAQQLRDGGTPCRSVVVVITDGCDVGSVRSAKNCKDLSKDLLASEQFVLAFVGVGDDADFKRVAKDMGVPNDCVLVEKNATAAGMRKVFQMVSQSAIKVSQGSIQPGAQAGFFS